MKVLATAFALLALTLSTALADESPFLGTWETNWGELVIEDKGESLAGTYSGQFEGTIEGKVKEGKLHYVWKQESGGWGSGVFTVSEDGSSIMGTWGAEKSPINGGTWSGKRK